MERNGCAHSKESFTMSTPKNSAPNPSPWIVETFRKSQPSGRMSFSSPEAAIDAGIKALEGVTDEVTVSHAEHSGIAFNFTEPPNRANAVRHLKGELKKR